MDPTPNTPDPMRSLSPEQARVLDALLEAHLAQGQDGQGGSLPYQSTSSGFRITSAPAFASLEDQARAEKIAALLALLSQCPASDPPADLVRRTIQKIEETQQRERMVLQPQPGEGGRRPWGFNLRWAEFGTVAALLLIGVSLLWPALSHVREDARRVTCEQHLALAGQAFGRYAGDSNGQLPMRLAEPGGVWWNVGKPTHAQGPVESNSAHLYQLVRTGYVGPDTLVCPENPHAPARGVMTAAMNDWHGPREVSYSSQNLFGPRPPRLDRTASMALLADKNPLFAPRGQGHGMVFVGNRLPATEPSPFHGKQGQNVLTGDGRVRWMAKPVLDNGDNFWLAAGVQQYNGTEVPTGPNDSFLVP